MSASPLSDSTRSLRFSTRDGFCASHLLDRDGTPLRPRAVGSDRDEQRRPCLRQRASAFTAVADGVDEGRELGAIRRLEALEEVAVTAYIGRLRAGTVWVNTYRAVSYMSPFGGFKNSGFGRENGQHAIDEFLQTKSVWINTALEVPNPFIMR